MKRLSIVLLCIALLTACENKIDTEEQLSRPSSPSAQSFQRHSTEALEIARQLFNKTFDTRTTTSSTGIQVIGVPTTSHLTRGTAVTSSLPDTLMYICNNGENNGFALISGDKRTPELLAYVPQGSYHQQDDINNSGFAVFISRLPGFIEEEIDKYNNKQNDSKSPDGNFYDGDSRVGGSGLLQTEYDWNTVYTIPACLTTNWGQGHPYNKYAPQTPIGYRALTGCVATAVGQLMVYHKHPKIVNGVSIDWNLLQTKNPTQNAQCADQVALLLRYLGDQLHNKWGEESTSAYTDESCKVLTNLGYAVFSPLVPFQSDAVMHSVSNHCPVIMRGQDERVQINGEWDYQGGHAWIIDGVIKQKGTITAYFSRNRVEVTHRERFLFHCNWGWYGKYNGYFESEVFDAIDPIIADNAPKQTGPTGGNRYGREHKLHFRFNVQCIPYLSPQR